MAITPRAAYIDPGLRNYKISPRKFITSNARQHNKTVTAITPETPATPSVSDEANTLPATTLNVVRAPPLSTASAATSSAIVTSETPAAVVPLKVSAPTATGSTLVPSTYTNSQVTPFAKPASTLPLPKPSKPGSICRTSKAIHQCFLCFKFYETPEDRKLHVQHHRQVPFQCDECDMVIGTIPGLQKHIKEHRENEPRPADVSCPMCRKTFRHENDMNLHKKIHSKRKLSLHRYKKKSAKRKETGKWRKQKTFTCNECPRVFKDAILLDKHMITKHPVAFRAQFTKQHPPVFPCIVCTKNFAAKEVLQAHIDATHTTNDVIVLDDEVESITKTHHSTDSLVASGSSLTAASLPDEDCSILVSSPSQIPPPSQTAAETELGNGTTQKVPASKQFETALDIDDVAMSSDDDLIVCEKGDVANGDALTDSAEQVNDNGFLATGFITRRDINDVTLESIMALVNGHSRVDKGDTKTVDSGECGDVVMNTINGVPKDFEDAALADNAPVGHNNVVSVLKPVNKNKRIKSQKIGRFLTRNNRQKCKLKKSDTNRKSRSIKKTGFSNKRSADKNGKIDKRSSEEAVRQRSLVTGVKQSDKRSTPVRDNGTVSVTSAVVHDTPSCSSEIEGREMDSTSTPVRCVSTCTLFTCSICGQTFDDPDLLLKHSQGHLRNITSSSAKAVMSSPPKLTKEPSYPCFQYSNNGGDDADSAGDSVASAASPPALTLEHDSAASWTSPQRLVCKDQSTAEAILNFAKGIPPMLARKPKEPVGRLDNNFTYDCVRCNLKVTGSWHLFLHIRAHMAAQR